VEKIIIIPEDDACFAVAEKLVDFCGLGSFDKIRLPFRQRRGGVNEALRYAVKLPKDKYLTLFFQDTDGKCPVEILENNFSVEKRDACINLIDDEVESWLGADARTFASYFKADLNRLNSALKKKPTSEFCPPFKSSLYLSEVISQTSSSSELRRAFKLESGRKNSQYNSYMIDFINKAWSIEEACENSDSLQRAIERIKRNSNLVNP